MESKPVNIELCSQTTRDLFATMEEIAGKFGGAVWVEDARDEHGCYAVWADFGAGGSDIVATGAAPDEALGAAINIARDWE